MLGVSPDRDPASCDYACVLWLVLWLCWRFNDVVFRISWLNNEFWSAATSFEFVLAVSGLRAFQQACFLYRNKIVAGNLPVTQTSWTTGFGYWHLQSLCNKDASYISRILNFLEGIRGPTCQRAPGLGPASPIVNPGLVTGLNFGPLVTALPPPNWEAWSAPDIVLCT